MLAKLLGCQCDETRSIKLEGAALDAVRAYEATVERLKTENEAARKEMWRVVLTEAGHPELVNSSDECKIDREYLDEHGIAFLKVPVAAASAGAGDTTGQDAEPATQDVGTVEIAETPTSAAA
ncbi:hypothetical protein D3093_35165 (plasmid) [Azospirillum argentinense]|uniref:Uncharacterized protein n=1 Tax=Azospirillum argentinense TaxID=2970906 RepID=A0A4D8PUI8_9PROT|nr:hypothetical protein [Azospirillum argentinense]QCO00488.1 hypothetical protein D3093_35165 [Azospirillum argentinense]